MATYHKYGWILIVILLILWIGTTNSLFQKGGVSTDFYFAVAGFVVLISILVTMLFRPFSTVEKILVAFPIALLSLFVTTIWIVPKVVDYFYGDKTWFLWETRQRIFINAVYYGLNVIIVKLMSSLYFWLRRDNKDIQSQTLPKF